MPEEVMHKRVEKNEVIGQRFAKTGTDNEPLHARSNDPYEEILNGPIGAGWSSSIDGGTVRFSNKPFEKIRNLIRKFRSSWISRDRAYPVSEADAKAWRHFNIQLVEQ